MKAVNGEQTFMIMNKFMRCGKTIYIEQEYKKAKKNYKNVLLVSKKNVRLYKDG